MRGPDPNKLYVMENYINIICGVTEWDRVKIKDVVDRMS